MLLYVPASLTDPKIKRPWLRQALTLTDTVHALLVWAQNARPSLSPPPLSPPKPKTRACQSDGEGFCCLFNHHELMNFNVFDVIQSIVALLFNSQGGHLWPLGTSLDCPPLPSFIFFAFWYKMFQGHVVFTNILQLVWNISSK